MPAAATSHIPEPSRTVASRHRGVTRWGAACVLGGLVMTGLLNVWQDFLLYVLAHQADEGYCLQVSLRLLHGEIPYRDYLAIWPPLSHLLTALSFRILGESVWAGRVPLVVFGVATLPVTYRWLRQSVARPPALAGVVVVWALFPVLLRAQYSMVFTLAPAMVAFHQLGRMRPGRLWGPAWWAGVACGIAMGMKHNVGIYVGLGIWTRLLCVTPYGRLVRPGPARPSRWWRTGIRCTAGAAALAALVPLVLRVPGTPATMLVMLGPAAVLTIVGTHRAWRADARAVHAPDLRAIGVACLCVALGVLVVTLPWVAWLRAHDAWRPFLEQSLIRPGPGSGNWGPVYGRLLKLAPLHARGILACVSALCLIPAIRARTVGQARAWTCGVLLLLVGAVWGDARATSYQLLSYGVGMLFLGIGLREPATSRGWRRATMLPVAAWFVLLAFPSATLVHCATALVPVLAVAVAWAWEETAGRHRSPRIAVVAVAAAFAFFGWTDWAAAFQERTPAGAQWRTPARLAGPRGGVWGPASTVDAYARMAQRLDTLAPPGVPLVAWPAMGLVNFYTDRPNPTHMDLYWPGLVNARIEATLLAELEAAAPPVVVLNTAEDLVFGQGLLWEWHPALAEYFANHYAAYGALGTWEVLLRMPSPPDST